MCNFHHCTCILVNTVGILVHQSLNVSLVVNNTSKTSVKVGQYLEDDLDALVEEAVDQQHSTVEGHYRQEKGQEPGQADGGNDSKLLHVFIQQGQKGTGQLLKHTLIHQSSCRSRNHIRPGQDPLWPNPTGHALTQGHRSRHWPTTLVL